MKIVGISDIHGDLIENIPQCDVLCIAGDIVPLRVQTNINQSLKWLKNEFIPWVEGLSCNHVILVAGNHDFVFDNDYWPRNNYKLSFVIEKASDLFIGHPKINYLRDSGVVIDNVSFYGTPWITGLRGWAFYTDDDREVMNKIPDVDVLITHAPPEGKVGTVLEKCWNYLNNFGSTALALKLEDSNIKYCLSGHIHSGLHSGEKIGNTMCYNVSIKNEQYNITFYPLELEI